VAQKFERIEKFSTPKAKASRMSLVGTEYHGLFGRVAARSNQGRNDGEARGTIPRAPKSADNVISTSMQHICFRKTSG